MIDIFSQEVYNIIMTPGTYDLTIYQGSTFARLFTVTDIDLDYYDSISMVIRLSPTSTALWTSSGSALTKTATTITLNIPASVTALFDFTKARYDIELTKSGATPIVDKILIGAVTLVKEYTHG